MYKTDKKIMIGMIHLPPSVGYPNSPGEDAILDKALKDLKTLESAGFDGVLIENDNDQPHKIVVDEQVKNSFARIVKKIKQQADVLVGMELIYDMKATLDIAHKVGCDFVRLDVFVDQMETKWGVVNTSFADVEIFKSKIDSKLQIFTDVHVKHAKMLKPRSLEASILDTIAHGSDGIILTGEWTGMAPNMNDLIVAHAIVGKNKIPLYVGSGANHENVCELLQYADGIIVGSSIKNGAYIDFAKASRIINTMKEKI